MAKPNSAGLLLYRATEDGDDPVLEVLLAHPGGPFYRNRDDGSWSIPKGLIEEGESVFDAARREFAEETGLTELPADADHYLELGEIRYSNGKRVAAWAVAGDCDPGTLCSNDFELEWPPRSGRRRRFPELDRFEFFALDRAWDKMLPAQRPFLRRLGEHLTSAFS